MGDNFVRFMGDTFARGGSFRTFRLIRPDHSEYAISKGGPHYMRDRLFRDTGRWLTRILSLRCLAKECTHSQFEKILLNAKRFLPIAFLLAEFEESSFIHSDYF